MSMSKLLEQGLENQVLNGLSRDNTKVNPQNAYYSLIHVDRDPEYICSGNYG